MTGIHSDIRPRYTEGMATVAPEPPPAEPRRFSIRVPRPLWIGVAALALVLVAAGLRLGVPVYRQQAAIAKIEILGGQVERHPFGPSWLRRWVDEGRVERFDAVHLVNLADTATHDTDLACLKPFSSITELFLSGTPITDDGMQYIQDLPSLEILNVCGAESISDAGMESLRRLGKLRALILDKTRVTDAGLRSLEHLRELDHLSLKETAVVGTGTSSLHGVRVLSLTRSSVSDEGLLVIRTIPRLKCLILDETAITDDGIAHLGAARSLEALYIARTRITDHGLTYLRGLTGLRTLFVDGTAITDAGLRELSSLKSLKQLSVRETRISDTAVAALQRELPNLLILKYSNN